MSIDRIRIDASYIVAFNGISHVILRDGVVVFEGNEIIHVGKSYSEQVDEKIEASGKLVIPGFIDLHAHIANSSLQKSWREDLARNVKTHSSENSQQNHEKSYPVNQKFSLRVLFWNYYDRE